MNTDPLFVANPKQKCPVCGGKRRDRRNCTDCQRTGMQPLALNGYWAPSAAFLVCGGPSIKKIPYHKLGERGICSLGINNIAGMVPVSANVFGDPVKKFHHGIFLDPKIMTFAPFGKLGLNIRAKMPDGSFRVVDRKLQDCPGVVGFSRTTKFDPETFFTTTYAHWGRSGKLRVGSKVEIKYNEDIGTIKLIDNKEKIAWIELKKYDVVGPIHFKDIKNLDPPTVISTMMLGFRILHYLGCPRVYLLGVDFWMTNENPYAFNQQKGARNRRYAKENDMLRRLKPIFDKEGLEVYNCNPESRCDVFPFEDFDVALEDCRGGVPADEFDLSGWYNKGLQKEMKEKYPESISITKLKEKQLFPAT